MIYFIHLTGFQLVVHKLEEKSIFKNENTFPGSTTVIQNIHIRKF